MKSEGTIELFERSIEGRKQRIYKTCTGATDSKVFASVRNTISYGSLIIVQTKYSTYP